MRHLIKINWTDNDTGRALMLANMGIAVKTISESTGLTESQVRYRMKKADIRLGDYRYGRSMLSRWLARCAVNAARARLSRIKSADSSTMKDYQPLIKAWRATKTGIEQL